MGRRTGLREPLHDGLAGLTALRASNRLLALRLGKESLARKGKASDCGVSARAYLHILVGHVEPNAEIMCQRMKGMEK